MAVSTTLIGASNEMWNALGSDGLKQLRSLMESHPKEIGHLRDALVDDVNTRKLAYVGKAAIPFAPVNRVVVDTVTSAAVAGAIDIGLRTARFGTKLLSKIPGPLREQREHIANAAVQAHHGAQTLQENKLVLQRLLKFMDQQPDEMRSMLDNLNADDVRGFMARLDHHPVGDTPEATAALTAANQDFRAVLRAFIGED